MNFLAHFYLAGDSRSLQADNWLVNYRRLDGVDRALQGLARRSSFRSQMAAAGEDLRLEYSRYEQDFREFFPLLREYSRELVEGGGPQP